MMCFETDFMSLVDPVFYAVKTFKKPIYYSEIWYFCVYMQKSVASYYTIQQIH